MKTDELKDMLRLDQLTNDDTPPKEISAGYTCDLLSWVMAHGGNRGMAWITVQTHMNVVAVATLLDMACVILPDSITLEPDALQRANEEGVIVFKSSMSAYEICGRMWQIDIPQTTRD